MKALSFRQIFSLVFVIAVALFVAGALSAWTGPTATAPSGNVAAPINTGATDQVKNAGLSLNALTVFGSEYIQTKLGINNPNPVVALDIAGIAKLGNGGEPCQAITEGAVRYNSATKVMEYCDGTAWKTFGTAIGTNTDSQVFTAGGTWTKPAAISSSSLVVVEAWGGGGGGSSYNFTGGGGGGAYTRGIFLASALSPTVNVAVGSGGIGGSSLGAGTTGGPSSFGSLLYSYGGGGGSTNYGGGGGCNGSAGQSNQVGGTCTAITPSLAFIPATIERGGQGGSSQKVSASGSCTSNAGSVTAAGGGGGNSFCAPGTSFSAGSGGSCGVAGSIPGGGGGGSCNSLGSGANGARGEVRVTSYW